MKQINETMSVDHYCWNVVPCSIITVILCETNASFDGWHPELAVKSKSRTGVCLGSRVLLTGFGHGPLVGFTTARRHENMGK